MGISPLSAEINANSAVSQTKRKTSLTQEDFMALFVAQMRNQNPLEPMDNYQMAGQMAQMGSLEALNNMNQSIQNLTGYEASMNSLHAVGLIGKKVEAAGNSIFVDQGKATEGVYQLARPGKVTIKIYDSTQSLVRVIEEGAKDTSKQKVVWDGRSQAGGLLPDGTYTFEVTAMDENAKPVQASSWLVGTITGVTFEGGTTYLKMNSGKITLSDIVAITG